MNVEELWGDNVEKNGSVVALEVFQLKRSIQKLDDVPQILEKIDFDLFHQKVMAAVRHLSPGDGSQ